MTAPDFTGWREPWPLTPTLHHLAEPKSVVVEMNRALPLAKNAQRPDRLPLRVLAGGLRLEGTMPGDLYVWARPQRWTVALLCEDSRHYGRR
ncbi:hypothetical protein ACIGKR_32345 [Rhodococcus qingshengii]|uniref:hypothetical protein n=1 Tax=Rhodococcus qingshengii TaxID=334542 RepID=UPI0037CAF8DC